MAENQLREEIVKELLASLKEDRIPWHQGWKSIGTPINAITDSKYKGTNSLWLQLVSMKNGFNDNRWCTFKQASDKGWKIKKGSKGISVEYWSLYDKKTKKNINFNQEKELKNKLTEEEYKERIRIVSKVYKVFNGDQIEGIPKRIIPENNINKDYIINHRNKLINSLKVDFREGGDSAFYVPSLDTITMPYIEMFDNEYEYLATFLHESAHSTGHESRLNRNISNTFGTAEYAKEELRAEISSIFISQELRIDGEDKEHMKNHKAYIQSWIDVLQNDPNELFRAIKDAQQISDYMIEKVELKINKNEKKDLLSEEVLKRIPGKSR